MKKYITDENTGISYTLVGDVYIPNLVSTDTNYEIGCWGRKHKEYIKQYKPAFYTTTNLRLLVSLSQMNLLVKEATSAEYQVDSVYSFFCKTPSVALPSTYSPLQSYG